MRRVVGCGRILKSVMSVKESAAGNMPGPKFRKFTIKNNIAATTKIVQCDYEDRDIVNKWLTKYSSGGYTRTSVLVRLL